MAPPEETTAEPPLSLSPPQLHALFDILTHHETYQEIQDFKDPDTIYSYGYPFVQKTRNRSRNGAASEGEGTSDAGYASKSSSPILSTLFNKFVLSLPPAKTLPSDFWKVRIQGLISQLAEAELSESYEQGAMGTRKTLATASSAFIEALGRGVLGGYPGATAADKNLATTTYDMSNAADFTKAWDDVVRDMVYGNLIDELFTFSAEHENIEEHSPAVREAAEYIIVHLAEFLHYVFVLSSNGRYLTKLVENIQQLLPYSVIRQTLRVSNAATMINGMMKLLLAKLSVGGLTNWIGLTSTADDGMNLLQRIISMVLSYDSSNFKRAAEKIEKAKDGPSRAQLAALREHMERPRQYHEAVRRESREKSISIVVAVLDSVDPSLATSLSEAQHAQCAAYYAAQLSIRDRREITNVFCRQSPDIFTQALRDGVAACDPIIRGVHDKIDLKEHVTDAETFVNEFIEVSKGTKAAGSEDSATVLPTVKDYCVLLRNNRHLLYKWLHRVAKETPDIRDMFRTWAVEAIKEFRAPTTSTDKAPSTNGSSRAAATTGKGQQLPRSAHGAGAMGDDLKRMFAALSADEQSELVPLIDAHLEYLETLDSTATEQRQKLLDKVYGPDANGSASGRAADESTATSNDEDTPKKGSGRFLAHWQELLHDTLICPASPDGPLRRGRDVAHATAPGKTGVGNGHKNGTRKRDGLMSGFSSTRSSRRSSPERMPAPQPDARRINLALPPPDVKPVVDAMGKQFRTLLVERD